VNLFDVPIIWGPNWNEIPDITIQDIYDMSPNVVWESVYSDLPINPSGFREESGGAMYQTWDGHYDNSYESSIASWNSKYVERENLKGRPIIRTEFVAYIWEDNYPNYTPNMYYGPLDADPCEWWQFGFCNLDDGGPMEEYMENNPTIPHIYWGGWHYDVPLFTYDWISLYKTINDRTYPADPYFTDHQEAPDYKQIGGTRPSGYIGFAADDNYDGDYLSDGITNNYDRINYAAGSVDGHGYSKKNTYMYKPIPDTLEIIDPAKQYSYVTEDYVNPELPVPADGHYPLGSACEGYYDWGQTYPTKSGSQCGGWIYANEYQYYGWMDSTDDYPNDPDNSAGITTGEPHLPFNGYTYNWYNFATQSVDTQYKPTRAYTEQDAINYINSQQYIDGEPVAPLGYVYWYDDYKVLDFEEVNHPYYYWYGVHVKKTTKVAYETNYESYGYSKLVSEVDHFPTLPDADFDGVNDGWPSSYYTRTENYDTTGVSRPYTIRYRTATSYESYIQDSDNDGLVNALDVNSDNDAFPDGLEAYDSTTYNDWLYTIATDAMLDSDRPYLEIYDPYNRDSGPLVQSWEISNTIGYSKPQAFVAVNQTVTGNEYEWLDYSDSYTTGEILGYITDSVTSFNADPIEDLSFKVENIFVDINRDGTYLSSPDNLIKDAITDFTATTHSVGGSTYEAAEFALSGPSAEAMTKMIPWETYDIMGKLINLNYPSIGQTEAHPFTTTFDKEDYGLNTYPISHQTYTETGDSIVNVGGYVLDQDSLGGLTTTLNDVRLWIKDNDDLWMEITDAEGTSNSPTQVYWEWASRDFPSGGYPANGAGTYAYKIWIQENTHYKNTTLIGPTIPGCSNFEVEFYTPIPDTFDDDGYEYNWYQDAGSDLWLHAGDYTKEGTRAGKVQGVDETNQFYNWAFNADPDEGRIDLDDYLDDSAPTRIFSTWVRTNTAASFGYFRFGLKYQTGSSGDHVRMMIQNNEIKIETEIGSTTGSKSILLPEDYYNNWYLIEFELEATADGMDCRIRYKKDGGFGYEYDFGTIVSDSLYGNGGTTDWYFEVYDTTNADYWIDLMDVDDTFNILDGELTPFSNPDNFDDGNVVGWTPISGYDYGSFTVSTSHDISPEYSGYVPDVGFSPSNPSAYRYDLYNGAPKVDIQDMLDTGGQTHYLATWIRRNHYNSGGTIGVYIADYTTSSISGDYIKLVLSGTFLRLYTDIGGTQVTKLLTLGKAYDDISWHIQVKLRSTVNNLYATIYRQELGQSAYKSAEYLIYSGTNGFEGYVGHFAVQTDGNGNSYGPVFYDDVYSGPTMQFDGTLYLDNPDTFEDGNYDGWTEHSISTANPADVGVVSYDSSYRFRMDDAAYPVTSGRTAYEWTIGGSETLTRAYTPSYKYWSMDMKRPNNWENAYLEFFPVYQDANNYIRVYIYADGTGSPDAVRVYVMKGGVGNLVITLEFDEYNNNWPGEWHTVEFEYYTYGEYIYPDYKYYNYIRVQWRSEGEVKTSGQYSLGYTYSPGTYMSGKAVIGARPYHSGIPDYGYGYFDNIRKGTTGLYLDGESSPNNSTISGILSNAPLSGAETNDLYLMSTDIKYPDITDLEWASTEITSYNINNQTYIPYSTNITDIPIFEEIGTDQWQSWHLMNLPSDIPVGEAYINTTYNALINGSWTQIYTLQDISVRQSFDLPNGTYTELQSMYSNIYDEMDNWDILNYEQKIIAFTVLKYIADLLKEMWYDDYLSFKDYALNFDFSTQMLKIFDPSSTDKVAIVTGMSHSVFSDNDDVYQIRRDYLRQIQNLTDAGYYVLKLTDEQMTSQLLELFIAKMDGYENQNTEVIFSYNGHAGTYDNGTEYITLGDGTLFKDVELNSMLSVLESTKQFIILHTCYAEGFSEEMEQFGRMILSSTGKTEREWIPSMDYYTPFYNIFMTTWNWSLSVEENYIAIYTAMINDPEIDYLPTLYDYDTENPCDV